MSRITTGSLINHLMSVSPSRTVPEVGMGATQVCFSDRHAFTVVEVSKSGKRITVQQDKATRTDKNGMSDCQDYTFEPNPNGSKHTLSLRKNGRWIEVGGSQSDFTYSIGHRAEYYDYTR